MAGETERLSAKRTALLVIDMQKYFVRPGHPFGKLIQQVDAEGAENYFQRVAGVVIPNIQKLQRRSRPSDACIAYTRFGSLLADGRDMPGWARRHNELGRTAFGTPVYPAFDDPTCAVDDAVAPLDQEIVVRKSTSGPVNSTKLDHTLRVLGIDTVVVTGVVTDVCVAQTVSEFGDRDFDAILVEDACATIDDRCHQATLQTVGVPFGTVLSTDQVASRMDGSRD